MTHKKHCSTFACYILHLAQAFLLEFRIANSKYLVDDKDFRLQMSGYGKGQADFHAAAVMLYWSVDEFFYTAKSNDLIKLGLDL